MRTSCFEMKCLPKKSFPLRIGTNKKVSLILSFIFFVCACFFDEGGGGVYLYTMSRYGYGSEFILKWNSPELMMSQCTPALVVNRKQ